jgi:TP901 family phage tail tape measure protein
MADFVLRAGVEFVPDARSRRSIKRIVNESLANLEARIAKARLLRSAQTQLRRSFREISFTINKVTLGAKAQRSIQSQVNKLLGAAGGAAAGGAAQQNKALSASFDDVGRSANIAATGVTNNARQLRNVRQQVSSNTDANQNLARSNKGVQSSFQGAGLSAENFGARIVTITARFAAYLVSIRAILAVQQAFRASLDSIVEFDNVLQDLRKVIDETPAGLARLSEGIFDVAQRTGASLDEVSVSLNTFVRQVGGADIEGALRKTEAALIAVNISELNANESTKFITSTLKIFGEEISNEIQALDLLSITADNAATTAGEVGRAFTRAASTAKLTGVSFRELTALITATIDRTQEAGTKVGTALKTIFTRLQTNSRILREQANVLGANIQANDSLFEVLQKLSIVFQDLDDNQKTQIATLVAGRRQVNIFAGLVESFGKAQQLLGKQSDAAGVALEKQSREQEKLSTQTNILVASLKELVVTLSGAEEGAEGVGTLRDSFSGIITSLDATVRLLTDVVKAVQSMGIEGLRVSNVFSAITKTAFFAGGALLIRGIVGGIKAAVAGAGQLTASVNNIAKSMGATNQAADQQVAKQKRLLQIEIERESVVRRILGLKQRSGRIRVSEVQPQRTIRDRLTTGRSGQIAAAGLIVALSVVNDAALSAATSLKESADSADRLRGSMLEASTAGIELGTTVGLLSGSLRAGLLVGLVTAGIQVVKFARSQAEATVRLSGAIEKEASRRISGAEALATENEALIKTLQEIGEQTGQNLGEAEGQLTTVLLRTVNRLSESGGQIETALSEAADVIQQAISKITEVARAAEAAAEARRAAEPFRRREIRAQLTIAGGGLGDFDEIDRQITAARVAAERLVGPLASQEEAVQASVRAMAAFKKLQEDGVTSSRELLSQFLLQSPELKTLSKELRTVEQNIKNAKNELEAQRSEVDGLRSLLKDIPEDLTEAVTQAEKLGLTFEGGRNAINDSSQLIKAVNDAIESATQSSNKFNSSIQELNREQTRLNKEVEKAAKANEKLVKDAAIAQEAILSSVRAIATERAAETVTLREQTADIQRQLAFENQLTQEKRAGLSATQEVAQIERRAARDVQERLRVEDRQQARVIDRLKERAAELRLVDPLGAAEVEKELQALERTLARRRPVIKAQLEAEVRLQLRGELQRFVQEQEKALANFRISEARRVLGEEQRVTNERIRILSELGNTAIGADIFEDILRTVPTQLVRQFGILRLD